MKIVVDADAEDHKLAEVDPVELGKRAARDHQPCVKCMIAEAFRITDPVVGVLLFERRYVPDSNRRL